MVELAEVNGISCEIQQRRWNWLGLILIREGEKGLQHWGGHQKDEGREEDQRPLGEGLWRKREIRQGGRHGM